jgi:hypothetical protein
MASNNAIVIQGRKWPKVVSGEKYGRKGRRPKLGKVRMKIGAMTEKQHRGKKMTVVD